MPVFMRVVVAQIITSAGKSQEMNSTTKIPSAQYLPVNSSRETFYLLSDAFIEKGDHVRLQDILLSYDIDLSSSGRIHH
jgi:hypothetical protein